MDKSGDQEKEGEKKRKHNWKQPALGAMSFTKRAPKLHKGKPAGWMELQVRKKAKITNKRGDMRCDGCHKTFRNKQGLTGQVARCTVQDTEETDGSVDTILQQVCHYYDCISDDDENGLDFEVLDVLEACFLGLTGGGV